MIDLGGPVASGSCIDKGQKVCSSRRCRRLLRPRGPHVHPSVSVLPAPPPSADCTYAQPSVSIFACRVVLLEFSTIDTYWFLIRKTFLVNEQPMLQRGDGRAGTGPQVGLTKFTRKIQPSWDQAAVLADSLLRTSLGKRSCQEGSAVLAEASGCQTSLGSRAAVRTRPRSPPS